MSDAPLLPPAPAMASRTPALDRLPAPADFDGDPSGGDGEARVRATAARVLDAIARAAVVPERSPAVMLARDGARGEIAAARAALDDAVAGLAARLRHDGMPPERMLVTIKAAVRGGAAAGADPAVAQELMGDAVRCGIQAYYGAASRDGPTSVPNETA